MEDYENVCRVCLHSTGAMSDIYGTYEGKSMQQQIQLITGLNLKKGDGYPCKVCHRCRHVVELACELREVAARSSSILIRVAQQNSERDSDDDDCEIDYTEDPRKNACQGRGQNRSRARDNDDKSHDDNNDDDSDSYYEDDAEESVQDCDESQPSVGTPSHTLDETNENNKDDTENAERNEHSVIDKFPSGKTPKHLTCQLCLELLESEEAVRSHVQIHYEGSDLTSYLDITKRPYICTRCDEVQLNKPQLIKHHRKHLGVNPYKCRHRGCSYEGKDRDGLRHHRVSHGAARRLCSVCGAKFRRRFEMLQHLERVHAVPGRGRVCHTCGWRVRCVQVLVAHMRAHHYSPRYPCPYGSCTRSYRSARALRDHTRAHRAGKHLYRCNMCAAAVYTSTSLLRRHMKTHDGSNLRQCPRCPAAFETRPAFERHYLAHHATTQQDLGYQSDPLEMSEQHEPDGVKETCTNEHSDDGKTKEDHEEVLCEHIVY